MRPAIRYDRASVRAFAPVNRPTVYRVFKGDVLVYVGATMHPRARLMRHLSHGRIVGSRVEFEFFRNATAMLRGEQAGLLERPTLNRTGAGRNGRWWVRRASTTPPLLEQDDAIQVLEELADQIEGD